ncbi:MAG: hypothetical protein C0511_03760 [Hyphomicrobium sp.]|nr:hypothetical protein [Hyphomicrobium sp.]
MVFGRRPNGGVVPRGAMATGIARGAPIVVGPKAGQRASEMAGLGRQRARIASHATQLLYVSARTARPGNSPLFAPGRTQTSVAQPGATQ